MGMARAGEHPDVGSGTEHAILARLQDHDFDLRMLEAQALQGVGKLYVDAEVVRVELQLIALEQRRCLVDVERQLCDLAHTGKLPVPIGLRRALKVDTPRRRPELYCMLRHRFPLHRCRPALPSYGGAMGEVKISSGLSQRRQAIGDAHLEIRHYLR